MDIVLTGGPSVFTCGSSPYRCFMTNQPLLQMVGSAALTLGMWYWYLRYQPQRIVEAAPADPTDVEGNTYGYGAVEQGGNDGNGGVGGGGGASNGDVPAAAGGADWSDYNGTLFFHVLVLLLALSAAAAAAVVRYGTPADVKAFAHGCGYAAGALNAVMWLPQIASTMRYKHKGALSLYWVVASVVSDIIYTTYLIFLGLDVSVWVNNVPDGIQTAVLFCLITLYSWRDRAAGLDDFGHPLHYTPAGRAEHVEGRLLLGAKNRADGDAYQRIEA